MLVYVLAVVVFPRSLSASSNLNLIARPDDYMSAAEPSRNGSKKNPNYIPHKYTRDDWGDRKGGMEIMTGERPIVKLQSQLRRLHGTEEKACFTIPP